MPRRKRKEAPTEPVPVGTVLEKHPIAAELQAEAPPPEREVIHRPIGPRGRYSDGWAKVVPVGEGAIRFRVKPEFNQVQISFDDAVAPRGDDVQSKFIRQMLSDDGWRYQAREKLWYVSRGEDKYTATSRAEAFFAELANGMLGYAGLEPARSI